MVMRISAANYFQLRRHDRHFYLAKFSVPNLHLAHVELRGFLPFFCGLAASFSLFGVFVPEDQTSSIMPGAAVDDDLGRPAIQVVKQERARAEGRSIFTR